MCHGKTHRLVAKKGLTRVGSFLRNFEREV